MKNPMTTQIFATTFSFQDVYDNMEEEQKKIIDAMNVNELELFIEKNKWQMKKGFEAGIMNDRNVVASSIADNLKF